MNRAFCLLLGLLLLPPALAWAQASRTGSQNRNATIDARCTEQGRQACVDWSNGLAIAVGSGAPASWARTPAQKNISATRAARLDAARNLLELIKGINLTSSSNIQGAMVANDTVQTSIQGRLFGIRPVEQPRYFSDGSVRVKLEARLWEVVPEELYHDQQGPPRALGPPRGSPAGSPIDPERAYSGLIIDARGTGAKPAMAPKVYDPEGREVYGSAYVSREFAVSQGMVGYAKSLEQARGTDRVRGNPAVIEALEAKGANQADLVIPQADADALRAISEQQTFLREARVMIVLD